MTPKPASDSSRYNQTTGGSWGPIVPFGVMLVPCAQLHSRFPPGLGNLPYGPLTCLLSELRNLLQLLQECLRKRTCSAGRFLNQSRGKHLELPSMCRIIARLPVNDSCPDDEAVQ